MSLVSIIIINYNTAKWLGPCLTSIKKYCDARNFEIIVVDNNSSQRDFEIVLQQFPEVHFIQSQQNIGFAAACNLAIKSAKGHFYLFLNPDTILHNNAIQYFTEFWHTNVQRLSIGCLGAFLQDSAALPIHSFGYFPKMSPTIFNKIKSTFRVNTSPKFENTDHQILYKQVEYITGANLFLSKNNFDLVGGFDERFFMYFEETDLQYRLFKKGYKSYLISQPKIEHFQGASSINQNTLLRVLYFNSLLTYFKKHSSALLYFFFEPLWCLLDLKTYLQKLSINKTKTSN